MSQELPRSEEELEELRNFYSTHDTADEVDAGEVVTPRPDDHDVAAAAR